MHKTLIAVQVAFAIFTMAASAKADLLFENPFPAPNTTPGACSGCDGASRAWDSFTLTSDSEITQIDALLHFLGSISSVNYSIWDASLSTELYSQTYTPGVDMTITSLGGISISATIMIPTLDLAAGDYYLSIYDSIATEIMGWVMTSMVIDGSGFQSQTADPLSQHGGNFDTAFRVLGNPTTIASIPEPPSGFVFATGLAALGFLGWRLRRRKVPCEPAKFL